jgi:methionine sulfoxide reductase catalytic subunit
MPFIHKRPGWKIPQKLTTPEAAYLNRRQFIAALGAAGAIASIGGCDEPNAARAQQAAGTAGKPPTTLPATRTQFYPADRNAQFELDRDLTDERAAGRYNNFYEFGADKSDPARHAHRLTTVPWTIEITGLVRNPGPVDLDDLLGKMPIEERLYRFRCVEAWAMAVPWTGFAFKALVDHVQPLSSAKYVRFETLNRPEEMIGIKRQPWYPWPYFEGLAMAEATNDLTLLAVGIYGKPMPNQHGAPVRLVVPWKYGYKSIKSIVKIAFVEQQPATFWNQLQPLEYGFVSNVNPHVPHPRWSQATERLIDTGKRVPTQLFNGYGDFVAGLYPDEPRG